jgi:hypothetical protein
LTYNEWKAQKEAEKQNLKKTQARKPDELKVQNISKYDKDDHHQKGIKSSIKKHEAYAPAGITGDVEVGFQPVGDEEEEVYERPRGRGGRGRGGRGGHRGDFRGAPRGGHQGRKHGNKFHARDDDFPTL